MSSLVDASKREPSKVGKSNMAPREDLEKTVDDAGFLKSLASYLWPTYNPDFCRRVSLAFSLFVASKEGRSILDNPLPFQAEAPARAISYSRGTAVTGVANDNVEAAADAAAVAPVAPTAANKAPTAYLNMKGMD